MNSFKKILITGGTGFLGAYIIRELVDKGYTVRAIRRQTALPFFIDRKILDQVDWVNGDILDYASLDDAMRGMDAVIHSAAKVSFRASERDDIDRINRVGTANVVNAALENKIGKLVHISSVAALGRVLDGATIDETRIWEDGPQHTAYAISKYLAEMEVWRGAGEGLNAVVVMPSTILGFGDWKQSSCALFDTIYKEFPWYSNGINGFVCVEDVARASVMLMESPIVNERFIVNADNWTFRRVFDTISHAFGKRPPRWEATPFLAGLAWRLEAIKSFISGKPSMVTRETARVAGTTTYFDSRKILEAMPAFRFTPLEQCIRQSCEHYLEYPPFRQRF